ncbi:MSMEG_0570 family nitrogen starvation response protein [Prauserella halophila]|nr:MSMEG_0570 family nitrogen starvation response protein [Prauserella halophila]
MYFHVRWPDGVSHRFYSPSTVIEDYLRPGSEYRIDDFLERGKSALGVASDRVAAIHGVPCGRARATVAELDRAATGAAGDSTVVVERFER